MSDAVEGPGTGLTYALLAAVIVSVGSVWFAGDRLRSFTLRGDERPPAADGREPAELVLDLRAHGGAP